MATTQQHTPGPWTARQYDHAIDGPRWYIHAMVGGGANPSLANLYVIADIGRHDAEANARLIALAPEMAEFVRSILDPLDLSTDAEDLIARYEEQARALLARLEG
jgi:hypothetical protein